METDTPALYTVKQVAQRYQVTPKTVRMWITEGALSAFKVGRSWRIGAQNLLLLENSRGSQGDDHEHRQGDGEA